MDGAIVQAVFLDFYWGQGRVLGLVLEGHIVVVGRGFEWIVLPLHLFGLGPVDYRHGGIARPKILGKLKRAILL